MIQKMSKSDHAFDMDAEPEPIPEAIEDAEQGADMSFNAEFDDNGKWELIKTDPPRIVRQNSSNSAANFTKFCGSICQMMQLCF